MIYGLKLPRRKKKERIEAVAEQESATFENRIYEQK